MSIAKNLTNLKTARQQIIQAINDKGVSCPTTTKLAQIPPYINLIQSNSWGGDSSTLQEIYDGIGIFTMYFNGGYGGTRSMKIPGKKPYLSPKGCFYFIFPYNKAKISTTYESFEFKQSYILITRSYRDQYLSFDTTGMEDDASGARWAKSSAIFYIRAQKYNNYWWSLGLNSIKVEKDSVCIVGFYTCVKALQQVKILDNNNNEVARIESPKGVEDNIKIHTMKVMVKKGYTIISNSTTYSSAFALCLW